MLLLYKIVFQWRLLVTDEKKSDIHEKIFEYHKHLFSLISKSSNIAKRMMKSIHEL